MIHKFLLIDESPDIGRVDDRSSSSAGSFWLLFVLISSQLQFDFCPALIGSTLTRPSGRAIKLVIHLRKVRASQSLNIIWKLGSLLTSGLFQMVNLCQVTHRHQLCLWCTSGETLSAVQQPLVPTVTVPLHCCSKVHALHKFRVVLDKTAVPNLHVP